MPSHRAKAAAVLDALEQGAPDVAAAYVQAAAATSSTPQEVAAESQSETIRAACRLREYGASLDDVVADFSSLTNAPGQAIRALIAQRWSGNRPDSRQRYRRIGIICPLSAVASLNAALAEAWAEPLTDSRGNGRAHPLHAQCLADNAALLNRPLYSGSDTVVGYGLRMQATPGDIARLRQPVQAHFAIFIEPQETDAQVRDAYESALAALGWSSSPTEP